MVWSIVGSFLHFLAAFGVCAMVLYELVFLTQTPSLTTAKNIQRADMIYGLSALLVVLIGFIILKKVPIIILIIPFSGSN